MSLVGKLEASPVSDGAEPIVLLKLFMLFL
jgi:hypothetical protein